MAALPKRDLLAQLEDNNLKQISASDVSSIVTTMYQPTLIYYGRLDDNVNSSVGATCIDYYFNPDYFQKKGYDGNTSGKTLTDVSQTYQFTHLGTGIPNGWSAVSNVTNINTSESAGEGLKMMVFGAGGVVTDYQVVVQGGGYRSGPVNGAKPGDELRIEVAGSTTNPTIRYRGVIRFISNNIYGMTFNADNGYHTQINTIPNMVPYSINGSDDIDDLWCRIGDLSGPTNPAYTNPNILTAKAGYGTNQFAMNISLWRINGA
jgi:hypothetical protein